MPESMISAKEFMRVAYGEWWKMVRPEDAKAAHALNVKHVQSALEEYAEVDRPLRILAVHGSSRSSVELSCAHEASNSQMLLRAGLTAVEHDPDVEIDEVNLREYKVEYCNNCVSTCSALCGFPCDCFPFDPMQLLYPKVLRCDVMFISTGVNQSGESGRVKVFEDRLISLDSGYFRRPGQFGPKNSEFRDRMIATSRNSEIQYDQRMHGRVAGFCISSKDDADEEPTDDEYYNNLPHYIESVAGDLYRSLWDFGWFFADPWLAGFAAHPNEDYSYDKQRLNENLASHNQAAKMVRAAVELARSFRADPPATRPHPIGRT